MYIVFSNNNIRIIILVIVSSHLILFSKNLVISFSTTDGCLNGDETPLWSAFFKPLTQPSKSDNNKSEHSEVSSKSVDTTDSDKKKKTRQSKKPSSSDNVCQYQCTHCAHTTPNWSNFEDHNKIFHRVHVMLKCAVPKCFKFYISKNGLKGHCIREHKDVLSCNLCQYIATGLDFLIDHKKSHDLKKFKCPFCTKGFGSAYDQNHHQVKCQQNPN